MQYQEGFEFRLFAATKRINKLSREMNPKWRAGLKIFEDILFLLTR
jgi:hypothetical protein